MRKLATFAAALLALAAAGTAHALVAADTGVDTQLEDASGSGQAAFSADSFKLKTFPSCGNLQQVVRDYLSGALLRYRSRPYWRGGVVMPMVLGDAAVGAAAVKSAETAAVANDAAAPARAADYSQTNVQVSGVDEGEKIKSDGTNLYYYNATERLVYVVKAFPADKMEVLKRIRMPDSFGEPELYVADGKLTIVASKWVQDPLADVRWIDRSSKTVVAVYGLSDPSHPKLERYLQLDGTYSRSRRVGDRLYVLSQTSLRVPYAHYALPQYSDTAYHPDVAGFDKDLKALSPDDVLPRKTEIGLVGEGKGNVTVAGKAVPYRATSASATDCQSVEYVLPDAETIKKLNIDPSFVTITSVNLADSAAPAKSKVVFGDVSEIHLGQGELYLAARQYSSRPWSCPRGAYCLMPWFPADENTLLHKFTVDGDAVAYKASAVVPGAPLSQYSMDADKGYFRIVTSSSYPERQTSVYVLDADLKKAGSVTGIAKGENFKAARFAGDRLYLVTFQQIDPLFVVSLADPREPGILGELKMPGYSTYLHPYDSGTLIGLGYGTVTNQWGGTQNAGLKVDLYDVSDVKNPKQLYTLDLGDRGSTSEALDDPRQFVWQASAKRLFLPVTLYLKKDATSYENKDAFQGVEVISIDKAKGISRVAEMTHIDTSGIHDRRVAACQPYLPKADAAPVCRKLLDGTQVCADPATQNRWVPEYCYADATDGAYFAAQMWDWNKDFVRRVAFMDSWAYTVADSGVKSWNSADGFSAVSSVDFGK